MIHLQLLNPVATEYREKRKMGLFKCSCGAEKIIPISRVNSGYTKTCGSPIHKQGINIKHGYRYTPEYKAWRSIKSRVLNPNDKCYSKYSKLGISTAISSDFTNFIKEVGLRPSPEHSIDRVDNTKGYYEGNIRWATRSQQGRNTSKSYRVTINGNKFDCLKEASAFYSVSITTITRWCDGYYDKRRNSTHKPKAGCKRELYYS